MFIFLFVEHCIKAPLTTERFDNKRNTEEGNNQKFALWLLCFGKSVEFLSL